MTFVEAVLRYAARRKDGRLTTRDVADRFDVPVTYAGAYTCNLARAGRLRRRRKVRQPGRRWFWIYELR